MTTLDRQALARDLRAALEGEVRFDTATRALYATDASNYRQPPIGVVLPRSLDDVVATHAVCREHGAPVVPRGCGTSLSGETVNVAVVVDCSKYLTRIGEVDPERRLVSVDPGAINQHVTIPRGRSSCSCTDSGANALRSQPGTTAAPVTTTVT